MGPSSTGRRATGRTTVTYRSVTKMQATTGIILDRVPRTRCSLLALVARAAGPWRRAGQETRGEEIAPAREERECGQ